MSDAHAPRAWCHHIALLVQDVERSLAAVRALGLACGPIEEFPGEQTRECYAGPAGQPARLLLLQPLGSTGPYARALEKRGPGLHHIALHTSDLDGSLRALAGWLLHPCSLETHAGSRTVWLARPGVRTLLEVHQPAGEEEVAGAPVVERLEVPVQDGLQPLVGVLRHTGLDVSPEAEEDDALLRIAGQDLRARALR